MDVIQILLGMKPLFGIKDSINLQDAISVQKLMWEIEKYAWFTYISFQSLRDNLPLMES